MAIGDGQASSADEWITQVRVFPNAPEPHLEQHDRIGGKSRAQVTQLKRRSGKDPVLLAGAEIARVLMAADVIDEYCVFIYPVVLGEGNQWRRSA